MSGPDRACRSGGAGLGPRRRRGCSRRRAGAGAGSARGQGPRPAARGAGWHQGRLPRGGHADPGGRGHLRPHDPRRGCRGGGPPSRRRRRHPGQDPHDAVRVPRPCAHPQSVESCAYPGRVLVGLGGGGGGAAGAARPRHADRRLRAASRRLLRRGRFQGDPRPRAHRRRHPARLVLRPRGGVRALGGGYLAGPRRARRRRSRRQPPRASAPARARSRAPARRRRRGRGQGCRAPPTPSPAPAPAWSR
jgi:hypothetical protein